MDIKHESEQFGFNRERILAEKPLFRAVLDNTLPQEAWFERVRQNTRTIEDHLQNRDPHWEKFTLIPWAKALELATKSDDPIQPNKEATNLEAAKLSFLVGCDLAETADSDLLIPELARNLVDRLISSRKTSADQYLSQALQKPSRSESSRKMDSLISTILGHAKACYESIPTQLPDLSEEIVRLLVDLNEKL